MRNVLSPKRLLVGRPLRSEQMGETLLPKKLALPVFCSDPLSSNAYATEEILLGLSLGGLTLFHVAPWIALAVIVLLIAWVVLDHKAQHRTLADLEAQGLRRRSRRDAKPDGQLP